MSEASARSGGHDGRCPNNASVRSRPTHGPRHHQALDETEREQVLDAFHSERFVDKVPAEMRATLLDEGTCHCWIQATYQILSAHWEVRESRNRLRHPNSCKLEVLADTSWDAAKIQVDLLLPLCNPGHLLPLCDGLFETLLSRQSRTT